MRKHILALKLTGSLHARAALACAKQFGACVAICVKTGATLLTHYLQRHPESVSGCFWQQHLITQVHVFVLKIEVEL